MRVAGVREFRAHAPEFMKKNEVVLVTRHGQAGFLVVPLTTRPEDLPDDIRREVSRRLGEEIRKQLARKGVTERRLLGDFEAWRRRRREARGGR